MPYSSRSRVRTVRMLVALIVPLAFAFAAGCGPDYKARGSVKGKVTLGKTALTTGTVMFHNANGITASGAIDTEGNYSVPDAPLGECTITVTVPEQPRDPSVTARWKNKMQMPGGVKGSVNPEGSEGIELMPNMPTKFMRIDGKYSKPETSDLKYTVEKGEQTHNIEL